MRSLSTWRMIPIGLALVACGTDSTLSTAPRTASAVPSASKAAKPPADPTATWKIPLADTGLSLKSDGQFGDGTYSVYAAGTCSVTSTIFLSGSGDNTISFSAPPAHGHGCGRDFNVSYPDGGADKAHSGGLQILESAAFSIPVGQSALRHFRFATSSRCTQGLVFGPNGQNPAAGSDSVLVTRIDAHTWQVQSQASPNDFAYCIDNNTLYEMQVSFVIVSSRDLP